MTTPQRDRNLCRIGARGPWCALAACLLAVGAATGCGKPQQAAAKPAAPAPASPSAAQKPARTPPQIVNAAPAAPKPEKAVVAPQPPPAAAPEPVVAEVDPVTEPEPEVVAVIEPDPEPVAVAADEDDGCGEALTEIRRQRAADPDDVSLRVEESRVLRLCGEHDRALTLLLDLSAAERTIADVAHEIADTFRMINEPGRAAMAFELCYIRDPEGWRWAARAAEAWLEAGERATARWWYEKARGAAPDSPEIKALGTTIQTASLRDR